MGYILNEDQKSLVAMAHDFCEKEIKPYAAQWDREGIFPWRPTRRLWSWAITAWRSPRSTAAAASTT